MNKKFHFIVVEGLSCSGKTTIAKEIAALLKAKYIKTPISPISSIRKDVDSKMSTTSKFLYYLSGIQHLSEKLKNLLQKKSVVCDKYIYSTIAVTKIQEPLLDLPSFVSVIEPSIKFLITVPEEIRIQRVQNRDRKILTDDKRERDREIEKIFKSLEFIEINNANTIEATMAQIKNHLKGRNILN